MPKLVNTFSWSHSAAGDFALCRRKRYWSKYASWGGWERDASSECKRAYRLNKMSNRFCLYGIATEEAVMWRLRQHQDGKVSTPEEVYNQVAKPLLRKAWDESKGRVWESYPKACCLHEHYYPGFCNLDDLEIMTVVADVVKACLEGFETGGLPRLAGVTRDMEVPVAVVGQGDPEHFELKGVKIYAIPDYVYVKDGVWTIVDWKAGSVKEEHLDQVKLYALWALQKHGIPPDQVRLRLEYLKTGESVDVDVTAEDLTEVVARIQESVQDMSQYLVQSDIQKNEAQPKEDWDLCYEPALCRGCSFFQLCRPELKAALADEWKSSFGEN